MFHLSSTAFQAAGIIPAKYSCDGENISPQLSWTDAPHETKSFALIMHDPDAPRSGGFTHWVIYNLPPNTTNLKEGIPARDKIPGKGIQGVNDSGRVGYMGPCPPAGIHRYYFHLYALDSELDLKSGAGKSDLESAMKGHVLAQTELMGRYQRSSGR